MWEQRAERLMRGPRGLHTRLRAAGVSYRQAERALGLAPKTAWRWAGRGSYPRFAHAMRLRAMLRDVSRGLDLARVPDGFYAGTERPILSAWIDEAVSDGWTQKGIAARSGVRPEAIRTVRRGGGLSLPNGLRLRAFLRRVRSGTIPTEPPRERARLHRTPYSVPVPLRSPYAGLFAEREGGPSP